MRGGDRERKQVAPGCAKDLFQSTMKTHGKDKDFFSPLHKVKHLRIDFILKLSNPMKHVVISSHNMVGDFEISYYTIIYQQRHTMWFKELLFMQKIKVLCQG